VRAHQKLNSKITRATLPRLGLASAEPLRDTLDYLPTNACLPAAGGASKRCLLRLDFYAKREYAGTMWQFILGFFPLLLCMALCVSSSAGAFRIKALSAGLLFGAAVCAVKALIIFPAREIRADFFALFWDAYVARFFSLFILGALFFIVFKGSPRDKAGSLFFLFAAYFAIAVPYRALSLVSPAGFFELCAAPLMYAF
jgi:hypothetical protein